MREDIPSRSSSKCTGTGVWERVVPSGIGAPEMAGEKVVIMAEAGWGWKEGDNGG